MTDYTNSYRIRGMSCMRVVLTLFSLSYGYAYCTPGLAASTSEKALDAQRELFKQALVQLKAYDSKGFERSLAKLSDYPLYDYLVSEQLQQQWESRKPAKADVAVLNAFERRTRDASLTRRLTRKLQRRFADTEQWKLFLGVSKSRLAATMPCTTVRARYETGQLKRFDDAVLELWEKPKKHPRVCADVIKKIEARHTPPVASIWQRIFYAMDANKPAYARSMLDYLASGDRKRVERWINASKAPQTLLKSGQLADNTLLNRQIVADLLIDWSREDTLGAVEHWLKVRDNYTFHKERYYDTHRALVMRAAYRRLPEAQAWLEATEGRDDDLELAEWRIRTALLAEDWPAVLVSISRLPAEEQEEDHWAYWVARALEQSGKIDEANRMFTELAELQSYYGFLAADRLEQEYAIYDEPIDPEATLLARLRDDPALQRAREFAKVDIDHESRREWNNWLSEREPEEIAASAVLAGEWGLHDRAIYSAGKSGDDYRRAISLRFPVLHRSEVAKASTQYSIEPAWIFGVMRRESAYIADIKSGAGAVGLMQLMPRTAKYVAGLQGEKNWKGDLTDVSTNIDFGSFYLRYVMDKFNDHQVLATASYNAGPHRVDRWLRDREVEADIWIDTIVFTETRRYVRAVMAYAAIYEYHLTGKAQRLTDKLKTVPAAPAV